MKYLLPIKMKKAKKLKPIQSDGKGKYYLTQLPQQTFKNLCAKKKVQLPRPCPCNNLLRAISYPDKVIPSQLHFDPSEIPGRFSKEIVDRFPLYLRRGKEYGEDPKGPPRRTRI